MPLLKSAPAMLTDAPTLSRNLQRLLQMRSILILCQFALLALVSADVFFLVVQSMRFAHF